MTKHEYWKLTNTNIEGKQKLSSTNNGGKQTSNRKIFKIQDYNHWSLTPLSVILWFSVLFVVDPHVKACRLLRPVSVEDGCLLVHPSLVLTSFMQEVYWTRLDQSTGQANHHLSLIIEMCFSICFSQ